MKKYLFNITNFLKTLSKKQANYLKLSSGLMVVFLLLNKIIPERFVDDWQYYPHDNYSFFSETTLWVILGVVVVMALIWLIWSIIWIVKGKPKVVDGEITHDPRRSLGYMFLFSPILLVIVGVALAFIQNFLYYLSTYIIGLVIGALGILFFYFFVIRPFVRIIKTRLWWGFVPFISSFILLFVLIWGIIGVVQSSFGIGTGSTLNSSAIPGVSLGNESFSSDSLGFSVGGAKDIDNFRQKVQQGQLPTTNDISYEGIFYDYYFNTQRQEKEPCGELFCPTYSTARSIDPFSGEAEDYVTVGFDSNISESDFKRKQLNIAVVLDISGSMSSSFDGGYGYDEDGFQSKLDIATRSIVNMIDHLNPDDRLSVVLFDDNSYLAKPFRTIKTTDIAAIKQHILDLKPRGGTDMEAGINRAAKEFSKNTHFFGDEDNVENRMIFLTDALPNVGTTDGSSLNSIAKNNARDGINMTFIGMGVDFDTELVSEITKVRGANYYAVHSANDFKKRLDDEFDYMVTPLVYDLSLSIDTSSFDVIESYGISESNLDTGEILKIGTLFPSSNNDGEIRGGVVLLKLEKSSEQNTLKPLTITASYVDRSGKRHRVTKTVDLNNTSEEFYSSTGIHKAIVLTRYVELMREWIDQYGYSDPNIDIAEKLVTFKKYFDEQINIIQDFELIQELELLQNIIDSNLLDRIKFDKNLFVSAQAEEPSPRIMYWYGKVNQHVDLTTGEWKTDSDGSSGANIDKLEYCQKVYPNLNITNVVDYKIETIDTWRDAGNLNIHKGSKLSYSCL